MRNGWTRVGQPIRVYPHIRVGVGDDLAGRGSESGIARRAQAAVWQVDDTDAGIPSCDVPGCIARPIVDDNDLQVGVGQLVERRQTVGDGVRRVIRAHYHRHLRPFRSVAGRKRGAGEDLLHGCESRLKASRLIHQAKGPVVDRPTSTPPLVGPGVGHRTAGAFGKSRSYVCRCDARLALETLAQAIPAGFREQQRSGTREMLQTREVATELGLSMQIDVVGEDVERIEFEVLSGREVYVRQQAIGCSRLHVLVELAQEPLDPSVSVPTDDPRRDLVAQREEERRGVRCNPAHGRDGVEFDASREPSVVEKWDVLRPRQSDHHAETVPEGRVEQGVRRRRVGAHRVDARGRHQSKVLLDALCRRKLRSLAVWSERAVGHSFDQDTTPVDLEELAVHVRAGHLHRGNRPPNPPRRVARPSPSASGQSGLSWPGRTVSCGG